jgi:hypothetical protein
MSGQQQGPFHNWELVHAGPTISESTYRMFVPGGWLYRFGGNIVFVPQQPTGPGF